MIDIELIGAPAFAIAVSGGGFTYAAINRRLTEITGFAAADYVGRTPEMLLPPDHAARVQRHYRLSVAERRSVDFESYDEAPSGGRWWQTTVTPVFDGEDGPVVGLIGIAVDISARKEAERRGREVDARIATAIDLLEGGFWHYGIAEGEFKASPQLSLLVSGADDPPLDGERYGACVLDEDRAALDFGPMVRGEVDAMAAEYRVRTASGELRWVSCKRRLTRDQAGRPENVIGVVVDITDQKRRQDLLAEEAVTDSLTGLMNRRGFEACGERRADGARAGGAPFGILLLDLDRFKPVNDTHGHPVGDAVLREVAARLRRHTRPGDAAARLGGDEFAMLVGAASRDELAMMARRLVDTLSRPIATAAGPVAVGASVGAAEWQADDRNLAALTDRADEALFVVKREGRGAWRVAD